VEQVQEFERSLLDYLRAERPEILKEIRDSEELGEKAEEALRGALDGFLEEFQDATTP